MNFQDYIKPELLILIPVCWGIGVALKASAIGNKNIPILLCVFSILLAMLWTIATGGENVLLDIFSGITQGILCWAVAWIGHNQIYKRLIENKDND